MSNAHSQFHTPLVEATLWVVWRAAAVVRELDYLISARCAGPFLPVSNRGGRHRAMR